MTKTKFKPVLFSTPMVQAILEDRKTQTRRIIKSKFGQCMFCGCVDTDCTQCIEKTGNPCYWVDDAHTVCSACSDLKNTSKAKYQVGDVLWVRETFELVPVQVASIREADLITKMKFKYKADGEECFERWKPSIHMPREAARIFLKVTNVRLERLQDISEADAIAEGVKQHSDYGSTGYVHYGRVDEALTDIDAVWSFETLWESINGKESWNQNPYVWVYDFERINKPADF